MKSKVTSLSANSHLLPDKDIVDSTLHQYNNLLNKGIYLYCISIYKLCLTIYLFLVEAENTELTEVVDSVSCWWTEFETIQTKIHETRESLTDSYPLAGSVSVINKQDENIQVINIIIVGGTSINKSSTVYYIIL